MVAENSSSFEDQKTFCNTLEGKADTTAVGRTSIHKEYAPVHEDGSRSDEGFRFRSTWTTRLLACASFRLGGCRRLLLQFALIVIDRGTHEILESTLIDLVALEQIDRAIRIAFETRIEELVGILQPRTVGEGELHLLLMGIADRDDTVARPDRKSVV